MTLVQLACDHRPLCFGEKQRPKIRVNYFTVFTWPYLSSIELGFKSWKVKWCSSNLWRAVKTVKVFIIDALNPGLCPMDNIGRSPVLSTWVFYSGIPVVIPRVIKYPNKQICNNEFHCKQNMAAPIKSTWFFLSQHTLRPNTLHLSFPHKNAPLHEKRNLH